MARERCFVGVEFFRIFAAFAVICIHFPPFAETTWIPYHKILYCAISHFCRFAVPFFFLVSGFFYGKNLEKSQQPAFLVGKRIKRFMFLFVAGSIIYILLPEIG